MHLSFSMSIYAHILLAPPDQLAWSWIQALLATAHVISTEPESMSSPSPLCSPKLQQLCILFAFYCNDETTQPALFWAFWTLSLSVPLDPTDDISAHEVFSCIERSTQMTKECASATKSSQLSEMCLAALRSHLTECQWAQMLSTKAEKLETAVPHVSRSDCSSKCSSSYCSYKRACGSSSDFETQICVLHCSLSNASCITLCVSQILASESSGQKTSKSKHQNCIYWIERLEDPSDTNKTAAQYGFLSVCGVYITVQLALQEGG